MSATLTVANSSIVMSVEGLYPSGVTLAGYAADDVFDNPAVENAELSMGIDGKLSAGYVFNPFPVTITLQADSPSLVVFEEIWTREASLRNKLDIGLTFATPANGKRGVFRGGFMTSYQPPNAKRILQPGVAVFTFARYEPSRTS